MREELVNLLASYLSGQTTLADCYYWLSNVGWDEPEVRSDASLRQILGRLELLSTEAVEGLRSESEFYEVASYWIAKEDIAGLGLVLEPAPITPIGSTSSRTQQIITLVFPSDIKESQSESILIQQVFA